MGVGDGDFQEGELVEDVEFGEIEDGVVVDEVRVLEDYEVEPSASTSSTCGDSEFLSDFLQMNSNVLSYRVSTS